MMLMEMLKMIVDDKDKKLTRKYQGGVRVEGEGGDDDGDVDDDDDDDDVITKRWSSCGG